MDNINYKYDPEVDAIFINLKENYTYEASIEINNNLIIDYDKEKLVAFEILDASQVLKTSPTDLKNINNIQIKININPEIIDFTISADEFTRPINSNILNNFNFSPADIILN